jgi:hypothetical protein
VTKLHDDEWRATEDLIVPWVATPDIGTSVPAGEVIPEHLREQVEAMERPARQRKA